MAVTVLMVAEKPIMARSIARILSDGRCTTQEGENGVCSVSTYKGVFFGKRAFFKVTSTCGHIMSLDFPAQYNLSWKSIDPELLYTCKVEKKEANPNLKMPDYLASVAYGCDYLVLWLDCDKEGENICFEVIDAVMPSIRALDSNRFMEAVFRARFSAVTMIEIKKAMANLVKPNLNESLSIDARQELDLRIGCSFTRLLTSFFRGKFGDLDSNFISFGPCQTPTLAICVARHDEILRFKSQPYWLLHVEVELPGGRTLKLEWMRERQFDKSTVQSFLNKVKKYQSAKVVEVTRKKHEKNKPDALKTIELLRVASSYFGLSPAQTMSVAERNYTKGLISYPRTMTTAYPDTFDFIAILREFVNTRFSSIIKQIISEGISKPNPGINLRDHPPITPMKAEDNISIFKKCTNFPMEMNANFPEAAKVYDYIVHHFLATLMRPCKYETTKIILAIGGEYFETNSNVVLDPGFTSVLPWMAVSQEEMLDNIRRGQKLTIKKAKLVEKVTTPPDYLTEAELITLMEHYGIGTDASIPVIIQNICNRNYVKVESNRRLVPTKLGITLVHGYQRVDPDLILPTMRADVEKQLDLIAKGEADYHTVKDKTLKIFRQKFSNFEENFKKMETLFKISLRSIVDSDKRCGKCRQIMKLKSIFLPPYCPNCQEENVGMHLSYEHKCSNDGFELLYPETPAGKPDRSFAFCSYCYSSFIKGRKYSFDYLNSFTTQGVLPCLNKCFSGNGILVFDPQSGPIWSLACDKCPSIIFIFEGAVKLELLEQCGSCEAKKMHVEYKVEESSKLPDKALAFTGCAFCEQHRLIGCINFKNAFVNYRALRGNEKNHGGGTSRSGGEGRGASGGSDYWSSRAKAG